MPKRRRICAEPQDKAVKVRRKRNETPLPSKRANQMHRKFARIGLVAAILLIVFTSPSAASCSDRPGTPDNVSIQATSKTSVRFNWRITTRRDEVERFYDIQLWEEVPPTPPSNAPKKVLVSNLSGVRGQGPYFLTTGGMDHYDFTGLKPDTR